MRRKRVRRDYPGCTTRSGNSRSKSSHVEGNLDSVVIIDVDSDGFENVIVVDVPESLQRKLGGSTVLREGGKIPLKGIVYIDDDADDDEVDPLENNVERDHDLDNDGTGSESNLARHHAERYVDGDDDCQVVNKKAYPFKLSKCKRTCAEKTTVRNHYGLYSEHEDHSSHSDSDCEVMDGSSGEFREKWEKAVLKRRSSNKNRRGHEDQAVPCSPHKTGRNSEAENKTDENMEHCANFENNSSAVFTGSPDEVASGGTSSVGIETFFTTFNGKIGGARFSRCCKPRTPRNMNTSGKADDRGETSGGESDDSYDERKHMNDVGTKSAPKETSCAQRSSHEDCDTRNFSRSSKQSLSQENVIENILGSSEHKGKAVLEESCIQEKPSYRDKDITDTTGRSFYITQSDETSSRMEASIISEQKDSCLVPKSNLKLSSDRDPSSSTVNDTTTVVDPTPAIQENIINDREKLKKTDEYRRAMEEEWAARQRQLQIQAEEAQRERKRRKAESLRLLEMKKRQKQRLEEVRESQKKVEENLNMKERLRSEVRREICRLEVMCNDMVSLLRGLGIQVGGGLFPSSDEVHAAYKRALLKFHPDRASRTDIQKQVEAEEKFKLISRMKEKFLSTSCL